MKLNPARIDHAAKNSFGQPASKAGLAKQIAKPAGPLSAPASTVRSAPAAKPAPKAAPAPKAR